MFSLQDICLRPPLLNDGVKVFQLVKNCPPLDNNSNYCNLLQCGHFSATSVAAEYHNELIGFISGYRLPENPETLFIWQVAVSEKARGLGLASAMLQNIIERQATLPIRYIETTITADNNASWALFKGLAKKLGITMTSSDWLNSEEHFNGLNKSESLVRLGPLKI